MRKYTLTQSGENVSLFSVSSKYLLRYFLNQTFFSAFREHESEINR